MFELFYCDRPMRMWMMNRKKMNRRLGMTLLIILVSLFPVNVSDFVIKSAEIYS